MQALKASYEKELASRDEQGEEGKKAIVRQVSTVPLKSNGTFVTCAKMADCTHSKIVIRNRHGKYLLSRLVS